MCVKYYMCAEFQYYVWNLLCGWNLCVSRILYVCRILYVQKIMCAEHFYLFADNRVFSCESATEVRAAWTASIPLQMMI